jgi:hypothetical protein
MVAAAVTAMAVTVVVGVAVTVAAVVTMIAGMAVGAGAAAIMAVGVVAGAGVAAIMAALAQGFMGRVTAILIMAGMGTDTPIQPL